MCVQQLSPAGVPAVAPIADSGVQEFTALIDTDSSVSEAAVCTPIKAAFSVIGSCQLVSQALAAQAPLASESGRRLLQQNAVQLVANFLVDSRPE